MSTQSAYSDVDRVRDSTDLVALIGEHVALRAKGREHVGLCPFHDDHKPSFAVVTHKGNAFYKCHACGAGGDAFDFVKNYHRMEFAEALRFLADRAGIALMPRAQGAASKEQGEDGGPSRAELRSANDLAAQFFRRVLQSENAGAVGRQILEERGIAAEMAEQFMIGLAPNQWDALLNVIRKRNLPESHFTAAGLLKWRDVGGGSYDAFRNRLIFPICNDAGQPVAFGARKINPDDEPKYLNSSESAIFQKSRTLYGLHLAKRAIIESKLAVVTEGYTDVIACHQRGIRNVVGTLGTALTKEHAGILSRLCDTVVLLFDGDEAGLRAADRGVEVFFAQPVDVRICVIPGGRDPDDLLRDEDGATALRDLIASAQDALAYKVRRFRRTLEGVTGLSAKQKLLEEFLAELSRLGFTAMQGVRKRFVLSQLADLLSLPAQDIERLMPRPRPPQRNLAPAGAAQPQPAPSVEYDDHPASLIPPARRRAERDLLAILLFDPSLAQHVIEVSDDRGRVLDLITVDHLLDEPARHIAGRVFAFLEAGESFTMQRLLGDLSIDEAKSLASSLYFEGERRCGDQGVAPLEALAHAARALLTHIELAEHNRCTAEFQQRCRSEAAGAGGSAGLEGGSHLREIIERRRKLSQSTTIAAAIAQGVRS